MKPRFRITFNKNGLMTVWCQNKYAVDYWKCWFWNNVLRAQRGETFYKLTEKVFFTREAHKKAPGI